MKTFLIVALLALTPTLGLDANPGSVEGTISEVLLYTNQARVTRTLTVAATEAGIREIRVGPLPAGIIDQSVQVDGTETLKVVSVQVAREAGEPVVTAEASKLQEELERLTVEVADLRRRNVASEKMLERFSQLEVTSHPEDSEELPEIGTGVWERFLRLVESGINTAGETIADIRPRLASKERALAQVAGQLRAQEVEARREFAQVLIAVQDLSGEGGEVRLNYRIGGATWYPEYQIDVDPVDGTIEITVHGVALQATGEDWKQVPVGFSTSQPESGAGIPELAALHIERPRFREVELRRLGSILDEEDDLTLLADSFLAGESSLLSLPKAGLESSWNDLPRASKEMGTNVTFNSSQFNFSVEPLGFYAYAATDSLYRRQRRSLQTRGFVRVFPSIRPETVLSGGTPHRLLLGVKRLSFSEERTTVAELSPLVFRSLRATLDGDDPLIGGDAAIFLGEAYLGITTIPTTAPGEEMVVDLGVDHRVVVTRTQRDREEVIGFLSKARLYSTVVTVKVENFHDTTMTIDLRERIPFTESDLITIELDDDETLPMPDRWNRSAGLLGWDLELAAGEVKTVQIVYTLEVPLDRELTVQDAPERLAEEGSR